MSRRGHGEGTIYHYREDWAAAVDLGWNNGKRNRRFVYGKTQREVSDKLKELRKAVEQGQRFDGDVTVKEFFTHWINEVLPGTVRVATESSYKDIATRHIIPILGNKKLRKLSPTDVRRFLQTKSQEKSARKKPHSARSLQYMHAVLRRGLEQARREELIVRNVAALVEPPRVRRVEVQPFNHKQARRLLTVSADDRLHALYVLALGVGLRKGELLGLSWADVDLKEKTLQVRSSLQRVNNHGLVLAEPKTLRSRRTIPLPEICIAALKAHRGQQIEEVAMPYWENQYNLVFTSPIGSPIDPRNLTRHFRALCERAKVPVLRFHDLRHTCASLLFAQGVDARTIMDTLGRSMIGTTMNLYTHIMPITRREAAKQMDEALGSMNGSTDDEDPPDAASLVSA